MKKGGSINSLACREFSTATDRADFDLPLQGSKYTWSSSRKGIHNIQCLLDRAMVNSELINFWDNISCRTLPRHHSDHSPLFINCSIGRVSFSWFYFQSMWLTHDSLHSFIERKWVSCPTLTPMYAMTHKLKFLWHQLRDWNKYVFGNLSPHIAGWQETLKQVQNEIELHGFSDDLAR